MFVQITLFNDTACENQQTIYMKLSQVKVEWGINRRGREKDRESGLKEREMECRRGPEMAWVENGHWK
jgi:hypothetical protein